MGVTITELTVADDPAAWRAAGFEVGDDGRCDVAPLSVRLVGRGAGKGVVGWILAGVPSSCDEIDGLVTTPGVAAEVRASPPHANGVTAIDHVVLMTPDLERTGRALGAIGLEPRRTRDAEMGGQAVRQVFYRLGAVILEVVGAPEATGQGPSRIWGITHTVADLDATAGFLGERVGRIKDAVQPGRRITTLRHRDLDMSVATAFISPPPPRC